MDWFLKQTCKLSANIIDWIRSIYFSLFCSSILTLVLKFSILSNDSRIIFIAGLIALLLGLVISVQVANRFKGYEKLYEAKSEAEKKAKTPKSYYLEKENEKSGTSMLVRNLGHFLFLTIGILALFPIGYGGFYMENKSTKSSFDNKEELRSVKEMVEKLDSSQQVLIHITEDNNQLHDSLRFVKSKNNHQEKQIDSLIKIIKKLTPKKIQIQKENK